MKRKYINQRGEEVELDLCDGEILPDGYGVRVAAYLVDGVPQSATHITDAYGREAGHRPGFLYDANDEAREDHARAVYDEGRRRAENAWRTPQTSATIAQRFAPVADQMLDNDVERARAEMKARISNAWRNTSGTGFGPGSFGA